MKHLLCKRGFTRMDPLYNNAAMLWLVSSASAQSQLGFKICQLGRPFWRGAIPGISNAAAQSSLALWIWGTFSNAGLTCPVSKSALYKPMDIIETYQNNKRLMTWWAVSIYSTFSHRRDSANVQILRPLRPLVSGQSRPGTMAPWWFGPTIQAASRNRSRSLLALFCCFLKLLFLMNPESTP